MSFKQQSAEIIEGLIILGKCVGETPSDSLFVEDDILIGPLFNPGMAPEDKRRLEQIGWYVNADFFWSYIF